MFKLEFSKTKVRWRYGVIAGIFLAIFACYPQFKMLYLQGEEWQGHYAYNDIDEVAYAAYLKALIDGRPRKNDPYTGIDDSKDKPQAESLFSIQFAAPYVVALPARLLGISAPTAMTISGALAAFLSALFCFWLISAITEDSILGMVGSLIVLCGGALAAGEGAIGEILGIGFSYPYFPFLRRYLPAIPFPVFFVLLISLWYLLKTEKLQMRLIWGGIALSSFSFLVFSYFYLWTTAAAWMVCIAIIWVGLRSRDRFEDVRAFILLGAGSFIPLIFYGYLLSMRSQSMDSVTLLIFTRQTDLMRVPVFIGIFVLAVILICALLKVIDLRARPTIFALSLAAVPIIVFNQQIISGRSLQPIHYQVFIGNYVALLALVVTLGIVWKTVLADRRKLSVGLLVPLGLAAVAWGFVECHYTVRVLDRPNIVRDNGIPLAMRLVELAKDRPDRYRSTVLSISGIQSDDSPSIAPQAVLWSRHQHVFTGLTWQENKERYYQYLYYQNLDGKWLAEALQKGDFVSSIALFGWGRHSDRLSFDAKPLSIQEIVEESKNYQRFFMKFSRKDALSPQLEYLVLPRGHNIDLRNIDKWYERTGEEQHGIFTLFKLKPRPNPKILE
ncbi:MAG: hypothetical protein HKN25_10465 [Pyrinomonadaceae bacterium]|nr:hypothetical protein [Pyrinomonadaceae bacterium]